MSKPQHGFRCCFAGLGSPDDPADAATERVLQGNNLAVYSGFEIGLVSAWKTLHDLCLHDVRVWEMFHVLLKPFMILNSASFVFV